jgi:hypothetical protein
MPHGGGFFNQYSDCPPIVSGGAMPGLRCAGAVCVFFFVCVLFVYIYICSYIIICIYTHVYIYIYICVCISNLLLAYNISARHGN